MASIPEDFDAKQANILTQFARAGEINIILEKISNAACNGNYEIFVDSLKPESEKRLLKLGFRILKSNIITIRWD